LDPPVFVEPTIRQVPRTISTNDRINCMSTRLIEINEYLISNQEEEHRSEEATAQAQTFAGETMRGRME